MTPLRCEPLRPLAWDSAHFGFPVAQLTLPRLPVSQLERVLRRARQQGTCLVYWPAHPRQTVPPALLQQYGGLLADEKVTYERPELQEVSVRDSAASLRWTIRPFPRGPASPALVQLAVAAGVWSRFRVDRRVPAEKSAALYTAWMERSTRHELADAVLVAARPRIPACPWAW